MGNRRRTVNTVEKITGTMKLVAQAQLAGMSRRAQKHAPFFLNVQAILDKFPKTEVKEEDVVLTVPVTSNRGLCGALNSQLLRDTLRMPEIQGKGQIFVIGDKGAGVRSIAAMCSLHLPG